jgi:transposase-like protein
MATRIDLPEQTMQQALEILRRPQSIEATAREMGINHSLLRTNLRRAGLLDEFKGRRFSTTPLALINRNAWDIDMANKLLVMKLIRAQA